MEARCAGPGCPIRLAADPYVWIQGGQVLARCCSVRCADAWLGARAGVAR